MDSLAPEHMDVHSRNQSLYDTLKGMGLFVSPVYVNGDPDHLDQIMVSAEMPQVELPTLEHAAIVLKERQDTA